MSNNSKAKILADLLEVEDNRWWYWPELLERIIPGFENIPARIQDEIIGTYATYIPHVREILDDRGRYLMRDKRSVEARFKVATPSDREDVEKMINIEVRRKNSKAQRVEKRISNVKERKILPETWGLKKLAKKKQESPQLEEKKEEKKKDEDK